MRKNSILRIAAAALMATTVIAHAMDDSGSYRYYGPGPGADDHLCVAWIISKPDSVIDFTNKQWLAGFLTAWNASVPGLYDALKVKPNASTFNSMVYRQCKAYPTQTVSESALTIVQRLTDRQLGTHMEDPLDTHGSDQAQPSPHSEQRETLKELSWTIQKSICPAQFVTLPSGKKVWFTGTFGSEGSDGTPIYLFKGEGAKVLPGHNAAIKALQKVCPDDD
jgi:hypothetical protein